MDRVEKIEIRGFRSLKDVSWEPDRLNVIIGANGSGKTNVLRSFELIGQSAAGKLQEFVLAEGGFQQLLWDHCGKEIALGITLADGLGSFARAALSYHIVLHPYPARGIFYVARETLVESRAEDPKKKQPLKLIDRDARNASVWDSQQHKLLAPQESVEPYVSVLSCSGGDGRIFFFQLAVRSFRIYNDLVTHRNASVRKPVAVESETTLAPDGSNLTRVLHTLYSGHRESKASVDAGMRAAFGDDFQELVFAPAEDEKIKLGIRWRSLQEPLFLPDLSDGTLRFLMLLAVLVNPKPGPLLAIDEPETGLHPRMFPIIAEFAASAAERSTVVLTTHSPEFLDAFPADCVPTTTVAECIEGETKLSKLDPGELSRWLKEYSLGHLFRSGELEALS